MTHRQMLIPVGKVIPFEYVTKEGKYVTGTITRRRGTRIPVKQIVVHTNGNPKSSLLNEVGWLTNPSNYKAASWNRMFKEHASIEVIPWGEPAYHAGNLAVNLASYGVELHEGGDFAVTLSNAIDWIADQLKNVMHVDAKDVSKYVTPHRMHTKTDCPSLIPEGAPWSNFIERIQKRMMGKDYHPAVVFIKPLVLGMMSKEVIILQTILNMDGANLTVDGDFGNKTLKAVKTFQSQNKLVVDGIVGPASQKVLTDINNRPYQIRYYDPQTQYVVIPKRRLATIKTLKAAGTKQFPVQSIKGMQTREEADIAVNGGLFDMGTGAPCHYFIHERKRINYNAYSPYALIIRGDGSIRFEDSRKVTDAVYGMSFGPTLYFQGKRIMDFTGLSASFVNAKAPKHAFIETKNYYIEVAVEGRNPVMAYTGRNSYQMADLCYDIAKRVDPEQGIINAGEYDGGASVCVRCGNREITRSYKVPRAVPTGLGYYFIK